MKTNAKNLEANWPAFCGNVRQLPWPCSWMNVMSFWSSSGVHGPLFKPEESQHLGFPIYPVENERGIEIFLSWIQCEKTMESIEEWGKDETIFMG